MRLTLVDTIGSPSRSISARSGASAGTRIATVGPTHAGQSGPAGTMTDKGAGHAAASMAREPHPYERTKRSAISIDDASRM